MMTSLILNVGETERGACILCIQAKVTLELEVMSLKNNIIEPCNWRLTSLRGSCAMYGENEPPPTLTFPLRVKKILVIGEGQEPHLASLFPMK